MTAATVRKTSLAQPSSAPVMRGFFGIMRLWGVDSANARAILGQPAERTFAAWKAGDVKRVQQDTIRRIGYVAGIYKALQMLYKDAALADSWVKRPNLAFGDQTPLQRMAAGDVTDLAAVRAYLDGARSPWS